MMMTLRDYTIPSLFKGRGFRMTMSIFFLFGTQQHIVHAENYTSSQRRPNIFTSNSSATSNTFFPAPNETIHQSYETYIPLNSTIIHPSSTNNEPTIMINNTQEDESKNYHTTPDDEITTIYRPNVLLILADDVGTGDIPYYWNTSRVDMPNIQQRLIEKGVTFLNAHSTPLCASSRYMLLSGNYPHRGSHAYGSWEINNEWSRHRNQFLPAQKSIASVLKDQGGYHTFMAGKYHLGGQIPLKKKGDLSTMNKTHILTSTDHDWTMPLIGGAHEIGFDESFITTSGIQNHPYTFFRDGYVQTNPTDAVFWRGGRYRKNHGVSVIQPRFEGEGDADWDSSAYNQILVNETERFIDSHMQNRPDDPMFMYVALGNVHRPFSPADKYIDGTPVAGQYPTKHMDLLSELDLAVGTLVSLIEERGLANDTVIILTSDNGGLGRTNSEESDHYPSGRLRGRKKEIYEGGHRVPLIIRHDYVYPSNKSRKHLVGLNDIYSTICDIAGVDVPVESALDSISFNDYMKSFTNVDRLRSKQSTWTNQAIHSESIQTNKWKVIQHRIDNMNGTFTSKVEMYDLANDIEEKNDLSKEKRLQWKMKKMLNDLRQDGPCPKDTEGKFILSGEGPKKGKERSCSFFKSRDERCKLYRRDGETHCPSICGRFIRKCTQYYWLDKFMSTA